MSLVQLPHFARPSIPDDGERYINCKEIGLELPTKAKRTYQSFFYLAAEKVICRHCKMCLELQVAFSFKYNATLLFNRCGY
jgi:hypothetical protein